MATTLAITRERRWYTAPPGRIRRTISACWDSSPSPASWR